MRSELFVALFLCVACEAHTTSSVEPSNLGSTPPAPPKQVEATTAEALTQLRATAAKMADSHFDAHFVITGDALRQLAPALETLPCDGRASSEIASLRQATEAYEQSDALRHVVPAREAMKDAVDALEACGHAGSSWISAARDAVAAIDTSSTFELQHTHIQDALRTIIDAIAASALKPAVPPNS